MPTAPTPPETQGPAGVLVVDKPLCWSSMDVVRRVRGAAGRVKTGHAGTLDPLATGVVVCCLGAATRCVERIMGLEKIYEAEVDLSAFTATDDSEGERRVVEVERPPGEARIDEALAGLTGEITQTPPAYSAVHVGGRRAYTLARQGQAVKLEPRRVRVYEIERLGYGWPGLRVRVRCGKGTYIRSLARDLGVALGTGGFVSSLRRTAVGPYTLAGAVDANRLTRAITQADMIEPPG